MRDSQNQHLNIPSSEDNLRSSNSFFDNQVLTVAEAAIFLRLSSKTVYKYSKLGSIPHKKIGGEIRFLRSELIEFLKGE